MKFSTEQRSIISSRHKHTLIPAVPGSGKSTLLREWVATQIEKRELAPELCTIIMFNVAAKEQFTAQLKKRMAGRRLPQVLTFHALGNRIHSGMMQKGILPKRTIVSEGYKIELMANQAIISVIGRNIWQSIKENDSFALDTFMQFVEQVKAQLSTPEKVFKSLRLSPKAHFFIDAYDAFEQILQDKKLMTLTDLIYLPVKACMDDTSIIKKLADKRDFIAVDEAQDMSLSQFQLFRILAGDRARTALIGDNDQTIYSWRGSDPDIMANRYQKQFNDVILKPLSYTFRYGHELAMASSSLISYNTKRLDTLCVSSPTTNSTSLNIHPSDNEGETGADLIVSLLEKDKAKYQDIIILCRLYASSSNIELACLSRGIPVFVTGNNSIFKTREADFIYALLMMATGDYYACNQQQRVELLKPLLRSPSLFLRSEQVDSLALRLASMQPFPVKVTDMPRINGVSQFAEKHIKKRLASLAGILTAHVEANAYYLINEYLYEVDYFSKLNKDTLSKRQVTEASDRMSALMNFIKAKSKSPQSILKTFNEMRERQNDNNARPKEAITVTTIHQAKGLDFPHVILPAVNDARYPYEMDGDFVINQDIEEERRLLYVAITRAIKSVHLLCPNDATIQEYLATGNTKKRKKKKRLELASRFIYEMQPTLVKQVVVTPDMLINHPTLLRYQQRIIDDNDTTSPE